MPSLPDRSQFRLTLRCLVDSYTCVPLLRRKSLPYAEQLHAWATEECVRRNSGWCGASETPVPIHWRLLARVTWLALAVRSIVICLRRGRQAYGRTRRQLCVDALRMAWLAAAHTHSPRHYYRLRFYDPSQRRHFKHFLPSRVFGALARRSSRLRGSDVGMLDHKERFRGFCDKHAFPIVLTETVAGFSATRDRAFERDLFLKPALSFGGAGCLTVPYAEDSKKWRLHDQWLDRSQLERELLRVYPDLEFLVQPRLRNHPDMGDLSPGALSTVRVLTAYNQDGRPDVIRASFRMARDPASFVDNFSRGGLAAAVDIASGKLGRAVSIFGAGRFDTHPATGGRILGRFLPFWNEAARMCEKAHVAAGNYNFLAWDVAIALEGPLFVECNVWPEAEIVQVPQERPLLCDELMPYFLFEFFGVRKHDAPLLRRPSDESARAALN